MPLWWSGLCDRDDPPTVKHKAALVTRVKGQVSGGSWDAAEKTLVGILGEKKRSTVRRWISLARDVSKAVLDFTPKDCPQAYACADHGNS